MRARAALLGAVAGACIAVAGSPIELVALAFLGPGLLLLAIERADRAPVPARVAVLAGGACGVAGNAITTSWIVPLLQEYGGFPVIAALPVGALMWIGQALPFALAAWLAVPLMERGLAGWLALPTTLTIAGSIAPMLFPWRLGISQMPGVTFVQLAELGGPPILDFALALGSCGALHAMRRMDRRAALAATVAVALPYAYGAWRLEAVRAAREDAPALRVGVVQPSIGIREKHEPSLRVSHLELHRAMTRALEAEGAELVLWPESSYPFRLDRGAATDSRMSDRRVLAGGVRGPLLFGALTQARGQRFNSVLGLERDGRFTGVYDKVNLLAFGEYVPFWDLVPPLQRFVHRGFTHGAGAGTIEIAGVRVGVLNCYEDLLAHHARDTAAHAPSFLANFTNDAWFGDTFAPHLHHMLARLRAVETRRDLVRAVNTGVSAVVHATGEDAHRTRPFERTSFVAEVRLVPGAPTPWVRFGDLLTPALLGACLALSRRRVRRAPGGAQSLLP